MKKTILFMLVLAIFALIALGAKAKHSDGSVPNSEAPSPIALAAVNKSFDPNLNKAVETASSHKAVRFPVQILIPSIGLNSPVKKVGLTRSGAMDVPSTPSDVGWYIDGTVPGEKGSAVMDAHVFNAFRNLKDVKVGESIYVMMSDGSKLEFVVQDASVTALASVRTESLFKSRSGRYLKLITCSGKWTSDRTTYTHRLIVSAELKAATR